MREANAHEAEGRDIIHMEVGQPGTPAPRAARERARQALETERLGYTDALGLPALRERIARYYQERYQVERCPRACRCHLGLVCRIRACLPRRARSGRCIAAAVSRLSLLPADPQRAWCEAYPRRDRRRVAMDAVARRSRSVRREAAGLLVASPNNPTGTMISAARLAELADYCRQRGLWLISDEIYHGLEYETPADTALAHWDAAIVVNSFSKYFSMTGWRIGWLVVPEELVRPMERLAQKSLHLAAGDLAGCRSWRLRRDRGTGGDQSRLCSEPRASVERAAGGGAHLNSSRRRRLLSLCRCERAHPGQRRLRQACCGRSASRSPLESTSIPSAAIASRASLTPDPTQPCARLPPASSAGSRASAATSRGEAAVLSSLVSLSTLISGGATGRSVTGAA